MEKPFSVRPLPLQVSLQLGVILQLAQRIISLAQCFLVGDYLMDRLVALLTNINALLHLLPSKMLLEPFIPMQSARNEMMKVV